MEIRSKVAIICLLTSLLITLSTYIFESNPALIFIIGTVLVYISITIYHKFIRERINLAEKELEKAHKEIREVEKMRSEFVANVSHELKTPLTSIYGFVETLQNGAIDRKEEREKFIDIIADETKRLERLINDILLLSDIENKEEVLSEKIYLYSIVENIKNILKPISSKKHIAIHNNIEEDFHILGSEDKVFQMMLNLIENAIKYGREKGNVWVLSSENDKKKIVVKDDGIGIRQEDLARVTERFYRGDKSRAKVVEGTGLGLSIVKHTAMLLGGRLIIESTENEGSSFSIEL